MPCNYAKSPSPFLKYVSHAKAMLLILSLFFLSNVIPLTNASNNSSDATVGWVTDPNGRGTFSLISSCLVTLGLCVWSAMHLNIPPHGESLAQSWKRNIKWGLIGVFAPELVVFAAWRQYNSAKQLCTEVREDFPDSPSSWRKERTSFEIQVSPAVAVNIVFSSIPLTISRSNRSRATLIRQNQRIRGRWCIPSTQEWVASSLT